MNFNLKTFLYYVHLTKLAQDLAKDQKSNFGDEIAYQSRIARKKKWNQLEDRRIREEIELQTYLNDLISKDKEYKLEAVRRSTKDCEKCLLLEREIENKSHQYISELTAMFNTLDLRRKVIFEKSVSKNELECYDHQ